MRWLVIFARSRGEKTMIDKLAGELLDASTGKGNAIKKGRMSIEWPKPTRLSRTIGGREEVLSAEDKC